MKDCFTYMFKSENSALNSGIFYILIFAAVLVGNLAAMYNPINMFGELSPLFFVFIILDIILLAFPCGYAMSFIKNINSGSNNLPEFEYKNIFFLGIKTLFSFAILAVLVCLIFYILGLCSNFFVQNNLTSFAFIIAAISFLISMIVSFMLAAGFYKFAKTGSILSFINYPELAKLIDKNVGNYFKYFIIYIILIAITLIAKSTLFNIFSFMGYFGLILYTASLSLIFLYTTLVFAKIVTKSLTE